MTGIGTMSRGGQPEQQHPAHKERSDIPIRPVGLSLDPYSIVLPDESYVQGIALPIQEERDARVSASVSLKGKPL